MNKFSSISHLFCEPTEDTEDTFLTNMQKRAKGKVYRTGRNCAVCGLALMPNEERVCESHGN